MVQPSSNLIQTKINAGGIAQFGASMSSMIPQLSPCGQRYAFDQYGREAPPDSIDTLTCPGYFSAGTRIEVENSLRSYLSPRYYDLPLGLSGGVSADSMFGNVSGNRLAAAGAGTETILEVSDLAGNNKNINGNLAFSALGLKYTGADAITFVPSNANFETLNVAPPQYIRRRYY
jgi:hypothetical protein